MMPFYFAYGANLDIQAMTERCPGAGAIGPASLADHAFHIMPEGYASVRSSPGDVVHGLLWRLAPSDVAPLDAFEDVAGGLYTKTTKAVLRPDDSTIPAYLYSGRSREDGRPLPGYMEIVIEAARELRLPDAYVVQLRRWVTPGQGGPASPTGIEATPRGRTSAGGASHRPCRRRGGARP